MKKIDFLFGLVAFVAACGGSSETPTTTPAPSSNPTNPAPAQPPAATNPPPPPVAAGGSFDFCTQVLGSGQTFLDRCCAADKGKDPVVQAGGFLALAMSQCDKIYGASASKGRLVPGPNHVQCLAAGATLGASSCTEFSQTIETLFFASSPLYTACRNAYQGMQDTGAPCLFPEECKAGLACTGYVAPSESDPGKEGTCGAPPAIGQTCGPAPVDHVYASIDSVFSEHPECAAGAHCEFGTCVAGDPPAYGRGKEGDKCAEERDCSFPLECMSNTCTAPQAAGGKCTGNKECNGYCDKGTCASVCGSR